MKKKITFLFFQLIFMSAILQSVEYVHADDLYAFKVSCPSEAQPGDPIPIEVCCIQNNTTFTDAKAVLKKENSEKKVFTSSFYKLEKRSTNLGNVYLTLLPLDTWTKPGEYTITVTGTVQNTKKQKVDFEKVYNLSVKEKKFISETLHLDATNTAIKTDTSTKRQTQINRLNDILFTTNTSAQYLTGLFKSPTAITRRTSFYGDRRVYAYNTGGSSTSVHYGIDFGAPTGSSVKACADGKVVLVEDRVSTGWSIVIEHMPGLYSLYYHLSKPIAKEGDIVSTGTEIGLSGATGLATGPHLHWEMRLLGVAVDPDYFISNTLF